jgi:hypothetical protein
LESGELCAHYAWRFCEVSRFPLLAPLRQQSPLSSAFPTGSYSYSHGIEWAPEAGHVHDRESLVDWLESDLCYGSGRNEAIFFGEAWRCAKDDDRAKLFEMQNWRPPFAEHRNLHLNHHSLAPLVGANLDMMEADALRMRAKRPLIFTNLKSGEESAA